MKETLSKIPVLGTLLKKVYRLFKKKPEFTSSGNYWEERYKTGGNSGDGSYNNLAEFKAEVINPFIQQHQVESVIDFGCGDGNQLQYFTFKSYLGFDVSAQAVNICREKYKSDASKSFKVITDYAQETAHLTMSLDVIYHLVEDETFAAYMQRLFGSAQKYVIVYSSNEDLHENNDAVSHVKHRKFTHWVDNNAPNFKLIQHIPNKYQYNGKIGTSYADFYIFEKQ